MNFPTDRIGNGLLKALGETATPKSLQGALSGDIEIVAPHGRTTEDDLWPAVWALAAAAERQFSGQVHIRTGLTQALASPSALGERCLFTEAQHDVVLSLQIGARVQCRAPICLTFDARRGAIWVGDVATTALPKPTALECFAMAGYAAFAALGQLAQLPPHREEYAGRRIDFPINALTLDDIEGISVVGLGQLGQAYLALLYFLDRRRLSGRTIALFDKDAFEAPNGRTQLLLPEGGLWMNRDKVEYLSGVLRAMGAKTVPRPYKLDFDLHRRKPEDPSLALVGVHDMEGRRIAMAAGFSRVIEAGVGTDFLAPRVTWHSLPGDASLGKRLFVDAPRRPAREIDAQWFRDLKDTPGECGSVEFNGVSATAPALGLVAAAFAMSEQANVAGRATLWSPGLPPLRDSVELIS